MALIKLDAIKKFFEMGGEIIRAVDDISFRVEEGEFVSIIGPSGCGKSTLMNVLGLLDKPDSGGYLLAEKHVASLSDSQRAMMRNQTIGFVFQSFNLLNRATAIRNVQMPLVYAASYHSKFSAETMEQMAAEALKRVSLSERCLHTPNELSGGQRQRVAIARALVNEPKLILADEPTGNLDSKSGNEIMSLFKKLNEQGVTIIMVTHDKEIAVQTKHQIALKDGKVWRESYAV